MQTVGIRNLIYLAVSHSPPQGKSTIPNQNRLTVNLTPKSYQT